MKTNFTASDVTDQSGKTIMVTGANTGLGYEAAKVLAACGARVLLACRSQDKANAAMQSILKESPGADLEFIPLDQSDFSSVRDCAERVKQEPKLDVLLNNAGIMIPPYEKTADGFESQFGVNHLGTFMLTCLLMDKVLETENSRIVVTSSLAHKGAEIFYSDINAEQGYKAMPWYKQSKFANILFMYELDRRLKARGSSTIAVGCHPGVATTELTRFMPKWVMLFEPVITALFNTPAQGAWPTLMAATWGQAKGGDYFGPTKRGEMAGPASYAKSTRDARDPEQAKKLWELSVELTGCDWR